MWLENNTSRLCCCDGNCTNLKACNVSMSCIQSPAWILLEIKLWSSSVIPDLWKRINGILIPASRTDLSNSGSCAITWWWLPQRYTQDTRRTRSWTENILRGIQWGFVPSFHLHVRSDDWKYGQARSHWVWTKGFHSITGGIVYASGSPTCSPNHWTTNTSNHRTNDPSNQRSIEPANHWTTDPSNHRTNEPAIHRTTKPLNQRVTSPVI